MFGLDVQVDYKTNRHTYLRVRPDGGVLVTTPVGTSPHHIARVIEQKHAWLLDRRDRVLGRGAAPLRLWGEPLSVLPHRGRATRFAEGVLFVPESVTDEDAAIEAWLRGEFRRGLDAAAGLWQPRVGATASGFRVRRMTSRWGSCNTHSGVITMNLALVHRRPALLDYVLVHELTHLHEASHGPRFKQLMSSALPEWRDLRRELAGRL